MEFYKHILILIFVVFSFSNIYATEVKASKEFSGTASSFHQHKDIYLSIINHGFSGLRARVTYEYEKQLRQNSLIDEDDQSHNEEAVDDCAMASYHVNIQSNETIDLRKLGFKALVHLQICGNIKSENDLFLNATFDKAFWQKLINDNLQIKCITLHAIRKDNKLLLLTDEEYSKHVKSSTTEHDERYIK